MGTVVELKWVSPVEGDRDAFDTGACMETLEDEVEVRGGGSCSATSQGDDTNGLAPQAMEVPVDQEKGPVKRRDSILLQKHGSLVDRWKCDIDEQQETIELVQSIRNDNTEGTLHRVLAIYGQNVLFAIVPTALLLALSCTICAFCPPLGHRDATVLSVVASTAMFVLSGFIITFFALFKQIELLKKGLTLACVIFVTPLALVHGLLDVNGLLGIIVLVSIPLLSCMMVGAPLLLILARVTLRQLLLDVAPTVVFGSVYIISLVSFVVLNNMVLPFTALAPLAPLVLFIEKQTLVIATGFTLESPWFRISPFRVQVALMVHFGLDSQGLNVVAYAACSSWTEIMFLLCIDVAVFALRLTFVMRSDQYRNLTIAEWAATSKVPLLSLVRRKQALGSSAQVVQLNKLAFDNNVPELLALNLFIECMCQTVALLGMIMLYGVLAVGTSRHPYATTVAEAVFPSEIYSGVSLLCIMSISAVQDVASAYACTKKGLTPNEVVIGSFPDARGKAQFVGLFVGSFWVYITIFSVLTYCKSAGLLDKA